MVLDGAMAPDLTQEEMLLGQAKGFETATRAWCGLSTTAARSGGSVDEYDGPDALRKPTPPARVEGDARVKQLTEGWAAYGVAAAMYDQGMWSTLTSALRPLVEKNDGTALMGLADTYSSAMSTAPTPATRWRSSARSRALDSSDSPDLAVYESAPRTRRPGTRVRYVLGVVQVTCGKWPIPATGKPRPIAADGAPPIVVIRLPRPRHPLRVGATPRRPTLLWRDGDL